MENAQTLPASFGELLKTYRKRKRLTQQQLAQQLGVHGNTVSSWELGKYLPATRGLVLELARHLALDEWETRDLLEASLTALDPHWQVPFLRNPYFTGREEILETLYRRLAVDQAVALTQTSALHGLGGVGKTQIALEYAYRYALEYSAVFWIGAETSEQISASLLDMAQTLQLPEREDKDPQRVVAAVQRWLSTHGQWLLIWDNVEDMALLDRFLPSTRAGTILLTTRRQTLGTLARGLDLRPMEQEEGVLFLLRRAKMLEPEATSEHLRQFAAQTPAQYQAAEALVEALGGLPLALDQAGAYLEETHCGLAAYLDLFRTRRAILLQQRGEGSRDHPASVSTTFTLAITATAERHPAVRDLLQVCALLQADAMPEELFRQGAEYLGAALEAVCRDSLEWDRVIGTTCAYSLLSRQPEECTLSMHRLVQAVLLEAMSEAEQARWNERAIEALNRLFPKVHATMAVASRKQAERLRPHALLCLSRVEATKETLVMASLAYKLGQYAYESAAYLQAEALLLRALSIRAHLLGPDHPEVTHPLNSVAVLYWHQGRFAEAEPLCLRVISIWEDALGPDPIEIARPLNNLAILYWSQGRFAEAEPLYLRALSIWERTKGADHLDICPALNNLAGVYLEQGHYSQAEPLLQRALAIREKNLGPDHPLVATSLNNLGDLYHLQGERTQAETLHLHALSIREQVLAPDHPDIGVSLNNLAELSLLQGNYMQAEAFYQRTLSIWEHALGPDHPYVALALNGQANLLREQGDVVQAEALYQKALALNEQQLGPHHPQTVQTLHDLAIFYQKQGNPCEALALAERALSIRSQTLGDVHPKTIATRALYTQLLQQQPPTAPLSETDSPTLHKKQEQPTGHAMSIAVRGETEQVAYTRTVQMREVTFTCTICGQTITQLHYPSGRIKYCSEACRAVGSAQIQAERVRKQREKRRAKREAFLQVQQEN